MIQFCGFLVMISSAYHLIFIFIQLFKFHSYLLLIKEQL